MRPPPPPPNPCSCRLVTATAHRPKYADPRATEPCFTPVPLREAKLGVLPWEYNGDFHRCWGQGGGEGRRVDPNIAQCLTPDRGAGNAKRALFLWGDSHGAHHLASLTTLAKRADLALAWVAFEGCGYYAAQWLHTWCGGRGGAGDSRIPVIQAQIEAHLREGDIIMIANDWSEGLVEGYQGRVEPFWSDHLRLYEGWLVPLAKRVGATVVILGDNPSYTVQYHIEDVSVCLQNGCTMPASAAAAQLPDAPIAEWAASHAPLVRYWRQWELWCDGGTCSWTVPGTDSVGYSDGGHLSAQTNAYLWPFMCSAMYDWGLL